MEKQLTRKTYKGKHWLYVHKKITEREREGKSSIVRHNGRVLDDKLVRKEISRHVSTLEQITASTPQSPEGWSVVSPPSLSPSASIVEPPHTEAVIMDSAVGLYSHRSFEILQLANSSIIIENEGVIEQMVKDCGAPKLWLRTHSWWSTKPTRNIALASQREDTVPLALLTHRKLNQGWWESNVMSHDTLPSAEFMLDFQILRAAFHGDISELEQLTLKGIEQSRTWVLRAALFVACKIGQNDVADVLLSKGVSANSRDDYGTPCLHVAAKANHSRVVSTLIRYKVHVNAKDAIGQTAWDHVYYLSEFEGLTSMLINAGARHNLSMRLYCAALLGRIDEVRFLLERGLDPSQTFCGGWNALVSSDITSFLQDLLTVPEIKHNAARMGEFEIVQLLVTAGAELNHLSPSGHTPLDMIMSRGIHEAEMIEDYLILHGAKTSEALYHLKRGSKARPIVLD